MLLAIGNKLVVDDLIYLNRKERKMSNKSNMRHYEIVFLIHPEQEEQVQGMIERYRKIITDSNGTVHRFEDWGRRPLAYSINDVRKAHYILMNVEAPSSAIEELENAFRFNDAVIRNIIMKTNKPTTDTSPILKMKAKEERRALYNADNQEQGEKAKAAEGDAEKVA